MAASKPAKKRLPLPKRFNVALAEDAYARLRAINAAYGFGNNYCLTFLLENLDEIADAKKLAAVFDRMTEEWGSPKKGEGGPVCGGKVAEGGNSPSELSAVNLTDFENCVELIF